MKYDLAIIGGGLAGLALAIQTAGEGFRTVLFEKEQYPFHRVCGEYISRESHGFLSRLGLPLDELGLPLLTEFQLSSPAGNILRSPLKPGGYGISRYMLDQRLYLLALQAGVEIRMNTKVDAIHFEAEEFIIETAAQITRAKMAVAAYGKRSNLDLKMNRPFIRKKPGQLNNYIGVKYHIRINHPKNLIALHLFNQGYCGISAVEEDRYCLCYLTNAANLQQHGSIEAMEKQVLQKNPLLYELFREAEFLFEKPVTIAQVSFDDKSTVEDHILMTGDSAGLIAPLSGNGMSMALHSSKLAYEEISAFLRNDIPRSTMEQNYHQKWHRHFRRRLGTGKLIQKIFYHPHAADMLLRIIRPFPGIVQQIIRQTHGDPF